jgi:hypothetical protein
VIVDLDETRNITFDVSHCGQSMPGADNVTIVQPTSVATITSDTARALFSTPLWETAQNEWQVVITPEPT